MPKGLQVSGLCLITQLGNIWSIDVSNRHIPSKANA